MKPSARSIEDLRYENRFVASLPGDPRNALADQRRPRQVDRACYSLATPTPVADPRIVALVPEVAALLDLSPDETPELAAVLGGNRVLAGMQPYAANYGGHQFGSWAGQLGDGRAINLAEVVNERGERWEMQLKGAGPTPYSRRADGRAVLRSSVRELVCSEAMFHLGVPTTRALSLVMTGDEVMRDLLYDGHPAYEPGAVVCRVAPSFLRFGNFELPASRNEVDTLKLLVNHTITTLFPEVDAASPDAVAAFFREVCRRTALLMVEWMRVGFVHGVMNTDNMSILGLTIDYGPYGWLEGFDPDWTPNITDAGGRRYRFGNQPRVAQWNLVQLANALVPLIDATEPLEQGLEFYGQTFARSQHRMLLGKLGLSELDDASSEADEALLAAMFETLTAAETDVTLFFRRLADVHTTADASSEARLAVLQDAYYETDVPADARARMAAWIDRYLDRIKREPDVQPAARRSAMNRVNPLYVPRNYLVQLAIDRVQQGDRAGVADLLDVLRRPYDEQPGREAYAERRPEWARNRPGCSMLSCSS